MSKIINPSVCSVALGSGSGLLCINSQIIECLKNYMESHREIQPTLPSELVYTHTCIIEEDNRHWPLNIDQAENTEPSEVMNSCNRHLWLENAPLAWLKLSWAVIVCKVLSIQHFHLLQLECAICTCQLPLPDSLSSIKVRTHGRGGYSLHSKQKKKKEAERVQASICPSQSSTSD